MEKAKTYWDSLSIKQRDHFLKDHKSEIKRSSWLSWLGKDFDSLPDNAKKVISKHVEEGLYKSGGSFTEFLEKAKKSAVKAGKSVKQSAESFSKTAKSKYSETKKAVSEKVKDQKRKIALDVLDETKDRVKDNKYKLTLKGAQEIIKDKYAKGGGVGEMFVWHYDEIKNLYDEYTNENELSHETAVKKIANKLKLSEKNVKAVVEGDYIPDDEYATGGVFTTGTKISFYDKYYDKNREGTIVEQLNPNEYEVATSIGTKLVDKKDILNEVAEPEKKRWWQFAVGGYIDIYTDDLKQILLSKYNDETAIDNFIRNSRFVDIGIEYDWSPKKVASYFNPSEWSNKMAKGGGVGSEIAKMGTTVITKEYIDETQLLSSAYSMSDINYYMFNGELKKPIEEVQKSIEKAKREIEIVNSRLPFTTWELKLKKGQNKFEFVGEVYEIYTEKKHLESYGWRNRNWEKNIYGIRKITNNTDNNYLESSPYYEKKEDLISMLNWKFVSLIYERGEISFPLPENPSFQESGSIDNEMEKGGGVGDDSKIIRKLEKKFEGKDLWEDGILDEYEVKMFDWTEEGDIEDWKNKNSKRYYVVEYNNNDDAYYFILVPKNKMAKGSNIDKENYDLNYLFSELSKIYTNRDSETYKELRAIKFKANKEVDFWDLVWAIGTDLQEKTQNKFQVKEKDGFYTWVNRLAEHVCEELADMLLKKEGISLEKQSEDEYAKGSNIDYTDMIQGRTGRVWDQHFAGAEIESKSYFNKMWEEATKIAIQELKKEGKLPKSYPVKYAKGGHFENENREMVLNNNKQIAHHTKELEEAVKDKHVPAWVVAKVNRSASDLSDATHYMEGQSEQYAKGANIKIGDRVRFKKNSDGYGQRLYDGSFRVKEKGKQASGFNGGYLLSNRDFEVGARKSEIEKYAKGTNVSSNWTDMLSPDEIEFACSVMNRIVKPGAYIDNENLKYTNKSVLAKVINKNMSIFSDEGKKLALSLISKLN